MAKGACCASANLCLVSILQGDQSSRLRVRIMGSMLLHFEPRFGAVVFGVEESRVV